MNENLTNENLTYVCIDDKVYYKQIEDGNIPIRKAEMVDAAETYVEVGTNGFFGGDYGHGGKRI